jgi:hypothetical protein
MNTADITCDKMTERSNYSENLQLIIELEVLTEIMNKCSSNWYDRVYLCWEDTDVKIPHSCGPIKGFRCYKYDSFQYANYNCNKLKNEILREKYKYLRHTMIPICKWVPVIFDRYILDWKLKNMYWLGNHTIYNGSCRYFKK